MRRLVEFASEVRGVLYIEDYAFGVNKTNCFSKLCEGAGYLKRRFRDACWEVKPIAISTVKKVLSGNGRATKQQMMKAFMEKEPLAKELWQHFQKQGLRLESVPCHPFEDMADAYGVLLAGLASDAGTK